MSQSDEDGGDTGLSPGRVSRRSILKFLGGAALVGGAGASQLEGDQVEDGLWAASVPNLTQQYEREKYVTGDEATFNPAQLKTGELAMLSSGKMGIKDEDGNVNAPPLGSSTDPIPSIQTEEAAIDDITSINSVDYANNNLRQFRGVPTTDFKPTLESILQPGTTGEWDDELIGDPFLIEDDGTFYMFYYGYDGASRAVGVATSTDLINWSKEASNPLVADEAQGPALAKHGSTWYMVYRDGGNNIGYATASENDLLSWSVQGNLLTPGSEGGDGVTDNYLAATLFEEDGTFYLFYSGQESDDVWRIYLATSSDMQTWTRQGQVMDVAGSGWDSGWIAPGSVCKFGGKYVMSYNAGGSTPSGVSEPDPNGFGLAISDDLQSWSRMGQAIGSDNQFPQIGKVWRGHLHKFHNEGVVFFNANNPLSGDEEIYAAADRPFGSAVYSKPDGETYLPKTINMLGEAADKTWYIGEIKGTGNTGIIKWLSSPTSALLLDTWAHAAPIRLGGSQVRFSDEVDSPTPAVYPPLSSAPSSPENGMVVYDSSDWSGVGPGFVGYEEGAWVSL